MKSQLFYSFCFIFFNIFSQTFFNSIIKGLDQSVSFLFTKSEYILLKGFDQILNHAPNTLIEIEKIGALNLALFIKGKKEEDQFMYTCFFEKYKKPESLSFAHRTYLFYVGIVNPTYIFTREYILLEESNHTTALDFEKLKHKMDDKYSIEKIKSNDLLNNLYEKVKLKASHKNINFKENLTLRELELMIINFTESSIEANQNELKTIIKNFILNKINLSEGQKKISIKEIGEPMLDFLELEKDTSLQPINRKKQISKNSYNYAKYGLYLGLFLGLRYGLYKAYSSAEQNQKLKSFLFATYKLTSLPFDLISTVYTYPNFYLIQGHKKILKEAQILHQKVPSITFLGTLSFSLLFLMYFKGWTMYIEDINKTIILNKRDPHSFYKHLNKNFFIKIQDSFNKKNKLVRKYLNIFHFEHDQSKVEYLENLKKKYVNPHDLEIINLINTKIERIKRNKILKEIYIKLLSALEKKELKKIKNL